MSAPSDIRKSGSGNGLTIQAKIFWILFVFLMAQALIQLYQNISQAGVGIELTHKIESILSHSQKIQDFSNLNVYVIQVQQWLTDVSATKAEPGFDDGFKEAEKYANYFRKDIGIIKSKIKSDADRKKLENVEKAFEDYYEQGVRMAHVYISEGHEKGNMKMADFDPFAERLTDALAEVAGGDTLDFNVALDYAQDSRKELENHRLIAVVAAVILIVINLMVLNTFFRFTVVNPVNVIAKAAERIASGDLTGSIDTSRKDEIGILSDALSIMQDNLKTMLARITQSSADVTSSATDLNMLASHIADGSTKQTEETTHVATSVEQMSATIMEIARNSSEALESSTAARETARNGARVVEETVTGIHKISTTMEKSAKVVDALGKNSEQISKIVSVIDDIADQTNLLALNAAIEAARAGEAGRGFAVVADEVRKLAERTTKATKEIATMINKIQADTSDAVVSMDEVMVEVKHGVVLADETGRSLKEIVVKVQNSADMVGQIATASEEQSKAVEEISRNVHTVTEVTRDTARDTQKTSASAQRLSQLAADLKGLVDKFKI